MVFFWMRWVVFLRAVNVGGANRCQPALIAKELPKSGVVNIGAVGTFVVRGDVSDSVLRAAIAKRCHSMRDQSRLGFPLAAASAFPSSTSVLDVGRSAFSAAASSWFQAPSCYCSPRRLTGAVRLG